MAKNNKQGSNNDNNTTILNDTVETRKNKGVKNVY